MAWTKALGLICLILLTGCEIPAVDQSRISQTPADARSFAVAKQAVRACYGDNALAKFRRAGFGVRTEKVMTRSGKPIDRTIITPPHPAVHVLYLNNGCYVGLDNMTPGQAAQLARIWVRAYGAEPNAKFGDGLSDHVSGAWRRFFTEPARIPVKAAYRHRIYISAYKTFPYGPYDPQKQVGYSIEGLFPDRPGAAVSLTHVIQCEPHVSTGPRSGVFLPCPGPDFKPR